MATNFYAPPKAAVADIAQADAPALWNPGAAASWSVLLTPAFGAYLHMKNWQALGESAKAANAKKWFVLYVSLVVVLTVLAIALPKDRSLGLLFRAASFAILLAWYFSSGKGQMAFVKSRFGTDYPRKSWGRPVLAAFGLLVGFGFLEGFVIGMINGFHG